ncbi:MULTISPECIES: hypothetical protein [unclassified Ruegeria]|uniref:hypothetical protein n=1 Tax=unclassified Ruegeria TaxID=2625375 RepID=UPI001ADB2CCE|nr:MULTISPECIES: hypothetical protein [unclassified Ruegeria]MBO9413213.1 hypothetical protein [Ruegeria sp. R8_1]MBO9416803.1 hypothetical protein [Ruegeria sp. R8_2]
MKKILLILVAVCLLAMVSFAIGSYLARSKLEDKIKRNAIELVQQDSFLATHFPAPHSVAEVYQFGSPFFNSTWAIAPMEQISEFSKRNQNKVNGDVAAILIDNWTKDDSAILFDLKDCGGIFCDLDKSDLQVVPRSSVNHLLRSGNPKVNKTIRSDGYQYADITPDFASQKNYLITAQIIRNNSGGIVEIFVYFERPASSFESFTQAFTGDPRNRDILKKIFFYYNYALRWGVEY